MDTIYNNYTSKSSKPIGRPKQQITVSDKERIANDIIAQLKYEGKLDDKQLALLSQTIDDTLGKYNVEKETTTQDEIMKENQEILEMFIAAKRIEARSPSTLYNYQNEVQKLCVLINKPIREIDTVDIRRYMDYRKTHDNLQNASMHNVRMYLMSFFKWCQIEEIVRVNPLAKIGVLRTQTKVKESLSEEDVERVRCACKNERDLAIVDMLSSSGMRVSELCGIKKNDVDFDECSVKITGKGDKQRIAFFSARCKVHLMYYLDQRTDDNPYLFVSLRKPYKKLERSAIEFLLREITKNTGINHLHLYPHMYRRTFATSLYNKGASVDKIQRLLGHQNSDTTLIYIKDSKETNLRNYKMYS